MPSHALVLFLESFHGSGFIGRIGGFCIGMSWRKTDASEDKTFSAWRDEWRGGQWVQTHLIGTARVPPLPGGNEFDHSQTVLEHGGEMWHVRELFWT